MKYQEGFVGQKADFGTFVKKMVPELFNGKLTVEGRRVSIPSEADLDYKVKFDEDEQGGAFTIKVSWSSEAETEEEEEEE